VHSQAACFFAPNRQRTPFGHPEAFIEAFANVYRAAADAIRDSNAGRPLPSMPEYPTLEAGPEGLAFVEAVVASSRAGGTWLKLPAR